jgi:tRNA modification GTPase
MDRKGFNYLLVGNKIDTGTERKIRERYSNILNDLVFISAKKRIDIEVLKQKMMHNVLAGAAGSDDTIVTNARHYQSLQEVAKSLHDIRAGLDNKLPGDLLAPDIRRCLSYLGEITGEVTNDDMLDYIFSKFCIGK